MELDRDKEFPHGSMKRIRHEAEQARRAATDRAWCEFLDVLTGIEPAAAMPAESPPRKISCGCCTGRCACWMHKPDRRPPPVCDYHKSQQDDDDNWRDGSMRDGMRRARRELP